METNNNINQPNSFIQLQEKVEKLKKEISKVIIGQESMIDLLLVAVLSNGHVLIEGVPGIAKTLTAKLLAKTISTGFSRIQFTPDLMPSDVTGTSVFNTASSKFEFNEGPVFSNIVLIDEINRAPAKTQSALFEVMEERQVTIDGQTFSMKDPFLVLATQNPLEHEGTYRLPEAQLDRFLFKIVMDYPSLEEEHKILKNADERKGKKETENIPAVLTEKEIIEVQKAIHQVRIDDNLLHYISEVINQTRNHPSLFLGASPRASLCTMNAAKAIAAMQGRDFVIPEDIKSVLIPVLIHRIYTTPEKEMEGVTEHQVIADIINQVEIPR
ncbi:MAG TPA: magnesium chelatase [Bacteroidales bacterium]|jgi:MoxR-like ATPase|nr:magnesium chelatase [Bacteroidales bacterium]